MRENMEIFGYLRLYRFPVVFQGFLLFPLPQEMLVGKGPQDPDPKARQQGNGEADLSLKARIGNQEEEDARPNPPEGTPGVFLHQVRIPRVICVKPYQHDDPGEGHGGDQPS